MSDTDYQAALHLAQKAAARQKPRISQGISALSMSPVRNLFGRPYAVGDTWTVAAWSFANTMSRMTTDPSHLSDSREASGRGGLFKYRVIKVDPEVVIEVTQVEARGLKATDPRVRSLRIQLGDSSRQDHKTYQIADRAGRVHEVAVSAQGIHSAITRLELMPLDVQSLDTAETSRATAVPTLPEGFRAIAAGFALDPARSTSFEQDDFFGRGVQAVWQSGKPWPSYIKTHNGIAVLIEGDL